MKLLSILIATALDLGIVVASGQDFLTNNLVAYYPFNGNVSDESGNANGATNFGGILTNDRFGNANAAHSFDGTSWIQLGSLLPDYASATFSVWVNTTDSVVLPAGIVSQPRLSNGGGLRVGMIDGFADAGMNNFVANIAPRSTNTFNDGVWHHILAVNNYTNLQLFIDGLLANSETYTYNSVSTSQPMLIGKEFVSNANDGSGQRFFIGKIDDIRIYNRALSSNEVAQLYAIESGPIVKFVKAFTLDYDNLKIGTNYQLQASSDLIAWTNWGTPFTATSSSYTNSDYERIDNWQKLFFRVEEQ